MNTLNAHSDKLLTVLSDMLESEVVSLERIGGGKNSQVYHLISKTSAVEYHFAVKRYFQHPSDPRNRLQVEFSSLKFIWENGQRCIPQPVMADYANECAIYEFIDGESLSAAEIGEDEIDQAVQFLSALQDLRNKPGCEYLPPASEACFSVREILDNIEHRLSRLDGVGHETPLNVEMHTFLDEKLRPFLFEARQRARYGFARLGKTLDSELSPAQRILSPSDFGFHNALRRQAGQLVFIDFEYFGWDDPVKTIADFLLHPHPIMDLPALLKDRFTKSFIDSLSPGEDLLERLKLIYPLFGIKWCIILLNEYLAADYQRRSFASCEPPKQSEILILQLEKAIHFYDRLIASNS
jgi:hypothetical protein